MSNSKIQGTSENLIWKSIKEKIRIFLVREGSDAWQCIDKRNANNLSAADDPRSRKLIRQTTVLGSHTNIQ